MNTPTVNANQALWEKGDFTQIANTMRASGEAFVSRLDIEPGLRVLDLGSGDGTTAIPAAKRGAHVLGIDVARNLVDAGNQRAAQLGLANCRFEHGCATNLSSVADRSMDLVVTIFGAMFAPDPYRTAQEMVRITRPGGKVIMGNWIPNDPTLVAQILRISAAYSTPPPAGFVSPMTWGDAEHVTDRFVSAGVQASSVTCERDTWTFEFNGSPAEFVQVFRTYYGPTMNAFDAASQSGRADELQKELEALFAEKNVSDEPGRTIIPATFMRVVVAA